MSDKLPDGFMEQSVARSLQETDGLCPRCKELESDRARLAENLIQSLKRERELEQRVKVLTEAVGKYRAGMDALYNHNEATRNAVIQHFGIHHPIADMDEFLNQTPQQTAAQIDRWHIEWMMKLPVAFRVFECCGVLSEKSHSVGSRVVDLYKIPPLPKESKE